MRSLKPIRGSAFVSLPEDVQKLIIDNGGVPVNDVFFDLWGSEDKILFLYGGFGSGKSVFIVDKLINDCRENKYFRCFYGRKVHDTVRISVFATLCDRIEELGLQGEFSYSRADTSTMIIRHRSSGNTFNPFGADSIDKLKSVKDPTHIFCEELDQFKEGDFGVLMSRLRTIKAKTQFIGAFNSTKVTDSHWLKQAFFSEDSEKRKKYANYVIKSVFCGYRDNYFIDQKEYEQTLWISAGFNEKTFREISDGEWGSEQAGSPFIFNFNRKKHIVKDLEPFPYLPIILSFDFNVEPITCLVGQIDGLQKVRILDEYRLIDSDIEELCTRIISDYPDKMLLVTGDASGQNRTALKRDLNYYKEIKRVLRLGMGQFKVPLVNPRIKNTRVLCNSLLKNHTDYFFSDRVPYLVLDIEKCQVDANGDIDKTKDAHQSHLLDCWRYFNWTFLHKFIDLRIYEESADILSRRA